MPSAYRWILLPRTSQRGVAIVVVMLMLLLITSLCAAIGLLTHQNHTNSGSRDRSLKAEWAWRAGVATAMKELTSNPAWSPSKVAPQTVYLDEHQQVGFKIWLEGINLSAPDTTITTPNGTELSYGQAAIEVVALVDGKEVFSGFSSAERTIRVVRPPVVFNHNALGLRKSGTIDLASLGGVLRFLSYDSSAGLAPWKSSSAPPASHQVASIRSLTDVLLGNSHVYGELVVPTTAEVVPGGGVLPSSEHRTDEEYLPRKFSLPPGIEEAPPAPLVNPVPPGSYSSLNAPPGTTVVLVRGATYFFKELHLGDDCTLKLTGPETDGPAFLYTHWILSGKNVKVNLPDSGLPPTPWDLQIFGTPVSQCYGAGGGGPCDMPGFEFGENNEIACAMTGHQVWFDVWKDSTIYGSVTIDKSVPLLSGDIDFHYDEALRGQTSTVLGDWIPLYQYRD